MTDQNVRTRVLSNRVAMKLSATHFAEPGGLPAEPSDATDFDVDVHVAPFNEETVAAMRAGVGAGLLACSPEVTQCGTTSRYRTEHGTHQCTSRGITMPLRLRGSGHGR